SHSTGSARRFDFASATTDTRRGPHACMSGSGLPTSNAYQLSHDRWNNRLFTPIAHDDESCSQRKVRYRLQMQACQGIAAFAPSQDPLACIGAPSRVAAFYGCAPATFL